MLAFLRSKRKSDTRIREGDVKMEQQSEWCGYKPYTACSHQKWEETRNGFSSRATWKPLRRSAQHLHFKAVIWTLNLWPPKPWENTFVLNHPAHDIYNTIATGNKYNFYLSLFLLTQPWSLRPISYPSFPFFLNHCFGLLKYPDWSPSLPTNPELILHHYSDILHCSNIL